MSHKPPIRPYFFDEPKTLSDVIKLGLVYSVSDSVLVPIFHDIDRTDLGIVASIRLTGSAFLSCPILGIAITNPSSELTYREHQLIELGYQPSETGLIVQANRKIVCPLIGSEYGDFDISIPYRHMIATWYEWHEQNITIDECGILLG